MIGNYHSDRPGLWRLGMAARKAGLTPDAFEAASQAGAIPVRVLQLSERGRYVPAAEFQAWLNSINQPAFEVQARPNQLNQPQAAEKESTNELEK